MDPHLLIGSDYYGEPMSPTTKLSTLSNHHQVIYCAVGFKNPIDVATLKDELSKSIICKIPRFTSLLVMDPKNGAKCWIKTQVNIEDHIFIHHDDNYHGDGHDDDDDGAINSCLADMATSPPMSFDKPLWEVHIMHERKCMVLRVHHALADGMSLMSLLWTIGRNHDDHHQHHHHHEEIMANKKGNIFMKKWSFSKMGLWESLKFMWYTLIYVLQYLGRCLWVKDKGTVICGIEGVVHLPRKVSTARFLISDMKTIKNAIPNATVNDVLNGIIWCGLTRYLNIRHPTQALQEGTQITGVCPVDLREETGIQDVSDMLSENSKTSWGNKFTLSLIPITYSKHDLDALACTARAKVVMDRKKHSMETRLCDKLGRLSYSLCGYKVASDLYLKFFSNTSFVISNMAGPQEEISIANNLVTFIRVTSSSQPHAITMHMVSYAGKADLQIQVAKEVIPDPQFLATCFEDALLEMKDAANKMD